MPCDFKFRRATILTQPMPTVIDIPGPYRFFFYSFDCNEPAHSRRKRENRTCKFRFDPVMLAGNDGFVADELGVMRKRVAARGDQFMEAWHEHCGH